MSASNSHSVHSVCLLGSGCGSQRSLSTTTGPSWSCSLTQSTLGYFCLAICHYFPHSPAWSLSAALSPLLPHFFSFTRDLHANAHIDLNFCCWLSVELLRELTHGTPPLNTGSMRSQQNSSLHLTFLKSVKPPWVHFHVLNLFHRLKILVPWCSDMHNLSDPFHTSDDTANSVVSKQRRR